MNPHMVAHPLIYYMVLCSYLVPKCAVIFWLVSHAIKGFWALCRRAEGSLVTSKGSLHPS